MVVEEPVLVAPWVHLCGLIAPFASIIVCCSPFPTIQRVQHERKTGNLPLLPYSCMIINATLWFAYGLLLAEPRIWFSNGMGLIMGIYYFVHFIQFAPVSSSTLPGTVRQHMQAIGITVLFTVFLMVLAPVKEPQKIIGFMGCFFCVLMFASPLAVLRVVLETKSARAIPLPFTVASLINCALWSAFGLWESEDPNIYIPNLLGLGFAMAQMALKLYYDENAFKEFTREALDTNDDTVIPLTTNDVSKSNSNNPNTPSSDNNKRTLRPKHTP